MDALLTLSSKGQLVIPADSACADPMCYGG
jgi:hypothetical protein